MLSQSIRTRAFPFIFVTACLLFGMLFMLFYTFVFTSIEQIFSQQSTAKLMTLSREAEKNESEFRNSVKILYLNRSVQRLFAKFVTTRADQAHLLDLQEMLEIWHKKQENGLYSAAMYVDHNGIPLVAIDFSKTTSSSNTTDLSTTTDTDTSEPTVRLDQSVITTWSPDNLRPNTTLVLLKEEDTHIIRSIYPILDRKTKKSNGFLSIDRPLSSLFVWNETKEEMLLIVDTKTGRLVLDSFSPENVAQLLDQSYPQIAHAEYLREEDVPPYAKSQIKDKELLIVSETLSAIGWELIHVTHLNRYISGPKDRGRLLVVGALVFLLVTGSAIYMLTRRVQARSEQLEQANSIVSEHNALLEQELQTAHEMQMRLMPQKNPDIEGYEVVGKCRPATEVGGDFFQYFSVDQKKWVFALADVTGHGMQAAVPTMVFSGLLDTEISYSAKPETLMPKLNSRLCRVLEPRTFVCLSLGELDTKENKMRISNGGCPYPYFYKASSQSVDELNLSAFPLGVRNGSTYEVLEVPLESGDVVVFCSDGIIEATGNGDELFGFERVERIISDAGAEDSNAEQIINRLFSELDAFSVGHEQDDDQTIVVVRAA